MIKTTIFFLQGSFTWLIWKTIGLPENELKVIAQREKACTNCQLRNGNWCSKKKHIKLRVIEKGEHPLGFPFQKWVYKIIKGCGCFLPIKKLSSSECPRNKWKKFQTIESPQNKNH